MVAVIIIFRNEGRSLWFQKRYEIWGKKEVIAKHQMGAKTHSEAGPITPQLKHLQRLSMELKSTLVRTGPPGPTWSGPLWPPLPPQLQPHQPLGLPLTHPAHSCRFLWMYLLSRWFTPCDHLAEPLIPPSYFHSSNSSLMKPTLTSALKLQALGFPRSTVVRNLPASAGDTGSSPGLGWSHVPRSN